MFKIVKFLIFAVLLVLFTSVSYAAYYPYQGTVVDYYVKPVQQQALCPDTKAHQDRIFQILQQTKPIEIFSAEAIHKGAPTLAAGVDTWAKEQLVNANMLNVTDIAILGGLEYQNDIVVLMLNFTTTSGSQFKGIIVTESLRDNDTAFKFTSTSVLHPVMLSIPDVGVWTCTTHNTWVKL